MLISHRTLRAQYLPDVSARFLADLARYSAIPAIRLGGRWLFDPEAVMATLKARETGGGTTATACADVARNR